MNNVLEETTKDEKHLHSNQKRKVLYKWSDVVFVVRRYLWNYILFTYLWCDTWILNYLYKKSVIDQIMTILEGVIESGNDLNK